MVTTRTIDINKVIETTLYKFEETDLTWEAAHSGVLSGDKEWGDTE